MPHAVYDADPEDARPVNVPPVDHEVEEWNDKLKGKKLGEKTDANCQTCALAFAVLPTNHLLQTFAKFDLPSVQRIISYNCAYTLEYCRDRSI
ncbi:hypothetical protein VE01_00019 [Pseudogymnoascus verrucosus]|uniref:Uncharacterized protein n=1 Tax=Pseudogymnoascus verrucosus TaxID=342668 RepID=A0A2P2SX17_9PEZI|nr:uncharacterized protein VE01_00019 [Pseudogymnoascus verrucosus]OBU01362.2 hypothetical protein VE01_00019 [Pseudogymnoascus verrucosus]